LLCVTSSGGRLNSNFTLTCCLFLCRKSVHACYVISHSNKLVQSSRGNLYVNALKRSEITERPLELDPNVLECMDDEDGAVVNSVRSQFGKRDAFYEFYKYHCQRFRGECPVDFYAFLSAYRLVDKRKDLAQRGEDFVAVGFIEKTLSFYLGCLDQCNPQANCRN
jgi:hypothetical protein